MTVTDTLLVSGRALNGLLAGTYLAFVIAVMPALRDLPDDTFARVMNRINVVIVNPVFVLLFLGAPALAIAVAAVRRDPVTIVAAVAAVIAVVITVAINIPLNEALSAGGTREAFESRWVLWHDVRTVATVVAFALLCVRSG